jgi:hypothetical protein
MHDPSRGSWIHLVDMRPHCSVNHPATHGGKRLHIRDPHSPLPDVHFEAHLTHGQSGERWLLPMPALTHAVHRPVWPIQLLSAPRGEENNQQADVE